MSKAFTIYFLTFLMSALIFVAAAHADCGDCGMSNHEYYGGK